MNVELSAADAEQVREILVGWRDAGVTNPLLPMEVDVDGDGTADSWGLDKDGKVIVVSGAKLGDTVFRADGEPAPDIDPDEEVLDLADLDLADFDFGDDEEEVFGGDLAELELDDDKEK